MERNKENLNVFQLTDAINKLSQNSEEYKYYKALKEQRSDLLKLFADTYIRDESVYFLELKNTTKKMQDILKENGIKINNFSLKKLFDKLLGYLINDIDGKGYLYSQGLFNSLGIDPNNKKLLQQIKDEINSSGIQLGIDNSEKMIGILTNSEKYINEEVAIDVKKTQKENIINNSDGGWTNATISFDGDEAIIEREDGSSYSGEFKNNKIDGYGEFIGADGSSYSGEFKNNKIDGYGKIIGADGSSYSGEFKNNKIDGYGEFIGADGSSYSGEFKNGCRTTTDKNGSYSNCSLTPEILNLLTHFENIIDNNSEK